MRRPRLRRRAPRLWSALFAAPAAWTAQHILGLGSGSRAATTAPRAWPGMPVDAITIVVGAAAARSPIAWPRPRRLARARDADDDDAPPPGRIHFLAVIGMTISPLFLAIILMSSAGGVAIMECVQS